MTMMAMMMTTMAMMMKMRKILMLKTTLWAELLQPYTSNPKLDG